MPSKTKSFATAQDLIDPINAYFLSTGIDINMQVRTSRSKLQQYHPVKPSSAAITSENTKFDLPTLSGLAVFLGFDSLEEFENYEIRGRFPYYLKRARLHITAIYEMKLLQPSPNGAIFALKEMGLIKKSESKSTLLNNTLKIEVIESGPQPAVNEKEVML
jgi:hypothetical protein